MERELFIRDADSEDAKKLVEIYSYYVLNTAVSFEYEVPSVADFENRIKTTKEKYPYMVCLLKDRIVGYAYAGPYSSREAYNWTATTSIYVDKDYRRQAMRMRDHIVLEKLITGQQQHLSMLIRIIADRVSVRCCTKSWKKGLKNRA